jgi:hypothetical protein
MASVQRKDVKTEQKGQVTAQPKVGLFPSNSQNSFGALRSPQLARNGQAQQQTALYKS